MPCLHWYAKLVRSVAQAGFLDTFIDDDYLLSDAQMGFRVPNNLFSAGAAMSEDEDEDEDENENAAEVSPFGCEHNNKFKALVITTAVHALDRRLDEGTIFEKKKKHDEILRRINRTELARVHNSMKYDDCVKDAFTYMYLKVLRQQLPASIWMALAPFCPRAHRPSKPYPSSMVLCNEESLVDSWFFSSTFYRTSKSGEGLTEHEKEACKTLSLFFNSSPGSSDHPVPRKTEKQIESMVRKNSSNISKLFRSLGKQYPSFSMPIPVDHAFGVCWRGKLENWESTPQQTRHMRLMCSLFPPKKPSSMSHLSCAVVEILLAIPHCRWDSIAASCEDLIHGHFYFAQYCGTPPPAPDALGVPFKLWGSVEDVLTPPVKEDDVLRNHKLSACGSMLCAAHSLLELLRESFGRSPPKITSNAEMDEIYKNWHRPSQLATDANLTACKRLMRVLRRPTRDDCRVIRFRGKFTRKAYKKAYTKVWALWSQHPAAFVVIFQFMRVIATVRKLDAKDLMKHECFNYASSRPQSRMDDRAIAEDIASYEMMFKTSNKPKNKNKNKNKKKKE